MACASGSDPMDLGLRFRQVLVVLVLHVVELVVHGLREACGKCREIWAPLPPKPLFRGKLGYIPLMQWLYIPEKPSG